MFFYVVVFFISKFGHPAQAIYIAQVEPLLAQLTLLRESSPVEAKEENIFFGFTALQTGQFNSEPSAPMG